MRSYNILDRSEDIYRSNLLEASAGTGKTFTIEHLVARFLIEVCPRHHHPLRLPQILIVTFTRAATRDLKVRIRGCLEKSIKLLKSPLSEHTPDYLKRVIEKGQNEIDCALNFLNDALFCFDDAQIFTIHGFCARALKENCIEANISFEAASKEDQGVDKDLIQKVIRDYFRSGFAMEDVGHDHLKNIWNGNYGDLEDDLASEMSKKIDFADIPELNTSEDVFVHLAKRCQKMLRRHLSEVETLGPDEWLRSMLAATENTQFCKLLRGKYQAVIIDEFQDTDPDQWTIFERLFINHAESQCPIYLVGDPKQSIYFFRQADIYTYLRAGERLGKSNKASLDTNFRSQPSLVKALNQLFSPSNTPDFMPLPRTNAELPYREVSASHRCAEKIYKDTLSSVHFIFSPHDHQKEQPLWDYILSQIYSLHHNEGIPFREIAILVKSHYQAREIANFLESHFIPTSLQRARLIGASTSIADWREILKAALSPKNISSIKIAMGNCLIGWTKSQVDALKNPEHLLPVLTQWQELSRKLQEGLGIFIEYFSNFKWKKGEFTTVERLLSLKGGLEKYQDFKHIGELLLEHQSETKASGVHLLTYLDSILKASEDEDRNDKFKCRFDPNQDAVHLLTTHASKGLEYDVVFAVGLMKGKKNTDKVFPISRDSQILLEPIKKESEEHLKYLQELDAEKMRQLYVALTRARYRVYLPACWGKLKVKASEGSASPMDLFLARLGQPSTEWKRLYERLNNGVQIPVEKFLKSLDLSSGISYHILEDDPNCIQKLSSACHPEICKPPTISIPGFPTYIQSFTSLSKKGGQGIEAEFIQLYKPPHDFHCTERSPHTLPSGSDTGNLIHKMIEILPFETAQKALSPEDLIPWVRNRIAGNAYRGWEHALAQILYQTFHTPLISPSCQFTLADVDSLLCFKEIEFLYPSSPGFLKGTIDCVIQHQGLSYILDWKSNWLGPSNEDYSQEALQKAMDLNQYDLQAQIYTEAWKKYCTHLDSRPFDETFGGVFYLFVRGPGVIHLQPQGAAVCKV